MIKTVLIIALAIALAAAVITCWMLTLVFKAFRLWFKSKQYPWPSREEIQPYFDRVLKDALKIRK